MTANQEESLASQCAHEDLLMKAVLGELGDDFDIEAHMKMMCELYPLDYPYPPKAINQPEQSNENNNAV